jgi:hypothetical protein
LEELHKEQEVLMKSFQKAEEWCKVVVEYNPSAEDIQDVFNEYQDRIVVFHFGGHANSTGIFTNAPDKQNVQKTHNEGLVDYFKMLKKLKLIFLNACDTKTLAVALGAKTNASVIGTSNKIGDKYAQILSKAFFSGSEVEVSWERAKAALHQKYGNEENKAFFIRENANLFEEYETEEASEPLYENWDLYGEAVKNWKLSDASGIRNH